MSFLDMARQRIAMAAKKNESAPDDAELKFRKGMAMVLESLDKADEKVVQELMTVLLDNLERRFAGKQPEQQAEPEQPATNTQRGPKTPDLESYFSTPTRQTDTRTPDVSSYFD
ncbi:hypothetical protein KOI90_18015 [Escherichia coli]|uniref:hypothetical protein n=1 Tax=Escherichia coli TaxID=562 RepID=UPI0017A4E3CB|nr:hypothetical protein [Escherichia coli]EFE3317952.1 hypothetical protein [Escherichia coli]EFH6484081.1 hypothetical protein [Escherichia coli]EFH6583422.1 hypothetical protein [Escherichia coli]EGM5998640.1 hypothetical protein [Escherichia coli]MBY8584536.1 hypothetical protein [Escherichia coli]